MTPNGSSKHAAQSIASWAYCDSLVQINVDELSDALEADVVAADGTMPNEAECMQLVCGDDNGRIPPELVERFPFTHGLLESYW